MSTTVVAVAAAFLLISAAAGREPARAVDRQNATPTAAACERPTPTTGMGMATPLPPTEHSGMAMGTPAAMIEFDQAYIDMMIPHHASIMAMAEAALPRLREGRLRAIAGNIIATQGPEIEQLRGFRAESYGSAEPAPLDGQTMADMTAVVPGMGDMAQMDSAAQVAAFCAADDPDLAFIDLTIPHHQSAIAASAAAVEQAQGAELRLFAERVMADQRREIDDLAAIRQELYASATPEAVRP